jgi:hypothetical protein
MGYFSGFYKAEGVKKMVLNVRGEVAYTLKVRVMWIFS